MVSGAAMDERMSKITMAPLPEWRVLTIALWRSCLGCGLPNIEEQWKCGGESAYWFSRTAWSFYAIEQWWERVKNGEAPRVWAPDYFCNQSLSLLRDTKAEIIFYPVAESLEPDWDACDQLASTDSPDIFILVHYFGMPANGDRARKFCDNLDALLVEDAAHVLKPTGEIGRYGDFVCYSPHKLLALPDGALLLQRASTQAMKHILRQSHGGTMEQVVDAIPTCAPSPWKWMMKRLLQLFLPAWLLAMKVRMGKQTFQDDPIDSYITPTPCQSRVSRLLLSAQLKRLDRYAEQRLANHAVFSGWVERMADQAIACGGNEQHSPYRALIRCSSGQQAVRLYEKCRRNGVPVQSWPDLAPEVSLNGERYPHASELRYSTLAFPVHQGLNVHDTNRMCRMVFNDEIKNINDDTVYTVQWFTEGCEAWDTLLAQAGKSNLLQSWAYGEAKGRVEGWKARRGVVQKDGRVIALFQALEKKWGLFTIIRINRGPLVLVKDLDFMVRKNLYQAVKEVWPLWRGKLLLIAPGLEEMPENQAILALAGYRRRPASRWQSSWINLSRPEDALRKGLKGKWRNQLNVAERAGLTLKTDTTSAGFAWMMERYQETMQEKQFQGTGTQLIAEYRKHVSNESLIVFSAENEAHERVAGILIVRHGDACTYWVGWNGEKGRRLNANNFLLWQAALEMKKRGCKWFDLGGIEDCAAPSIARFKRGMNGEEYQLIGEWWATQV